MAAGLGFKDFTTGEVLTAADVDGYLMQGVWVFASAAARDAAVTSPQEGNFAYLKDTNVTTYYTGSAWANLDTTGMTNPMTTTGDTIYSSSGSTPARLGIGSTGQVLTVAGGVPSWATPASGGGMTSIASGSLSGSSLDLTSISGSYKNLQLVLRGANTSNSVEITVRLNGITTSTYNGLNIVNNNGAVETVAGIAQDKNFITYYNTNTTTNAAIIYNLFDYTNTTSHKQITSQMNYVRDNGNYNSCYLVGACRTNNAIDRITVAVSAGTWSSGTYELFGVK